MFQTINPVNNELLASFPALSELELQQKLDLAAAAFQKSWRSITVQQRADYVGKIGQQLRANRKIYADLITLEMGKPIRQSLAEIDKCAWLCEYFTVHAATFLQDRIVSTEYQKSYVRYEPIGAVLGIMPWNFPFWQVFRFAVPALCAGNVILLKPAPNVPQCALAIEQICVETIGIAGVFQTLLVDVEQVARILEHPIVQGVALTGSDRAGASVAALAGSQIKKCVLELGGSDAFIVLDDADVPQAARVGVLSRMNNNGQTCIAAKRFIVQESVAETFLQHFAAEINQLQVGDPTDERTDISVLARPDLCRQLQGQVQQFLNWGARLISSSLLPAAEGNYFPPSILTQISPGTPAYREELFGPVALVVTVKDDEEAIAVANDSPYGLGAAIWSSDPARAEAIARRLEAGAVFINDFVKSDPRLPFGGVKRSGYGRELAEEGSMEFTNIKTVVIR